MLFKINEKTKNMIPVYILLIVSLFYFKPTMVFRPDGKPREYGFGIDSGNQKRTLFNLHFIILIIAVILYFQYTSG